MNRRLNNLPARNGFTLVEMLTVVVIIALLIAIIVPAIGNVPRNTKRAAARLAAANMDKACHLYFDEFREFPPSEPGKAPAAWGMGSAEGRYLLAQYLTGYLDSDLEDGPGWRTVARGTVHGPYNDTEKLELTTTAPRAFVDPFGNEFFYYRFDKRPSDTARKYHDGDNTIAGGTPKEKRPDMADGKYVTVGTTKWRQDPDGDFVIMSAGPDGVFDPVWQPRTDDVTNFSAEN